MSCYLGIDTSNYTTSAAVYDSESRQVKMFKKLLAVKKGSAGLKQSDAVFAHVKQLGGVINEVMSAQKQPLSAVGVSTFPRRAQGSYMPCFLVGDLAADAITVSLHVPKYTFSHQEGHVAAAAYSADKLCLLKEKFLAFHVSGGTTECLLVLPDDNNIFSVEVVGASLDLNAGQAIDRIGVKMGLPFPAGRYIDALAADCNDNIQVRASVQGTSCSLSGLENQCYRLMDQGKKNSYVAKYCVLYIQASVEGMLMNAFDQYGKMEVLFAGGVMSNTMLQSYFKEKYKGWFAKPAFSSDNAAGTAILASIRNEKNAKY